MTIEKLACPFSAGRPVPFGIEEGILWIFLELNDRTNRRTVIMNDTELLLRNDYFLAFENFIEAPAPGLALRIVCRGSENETDLLLNLDGTVDRWQIDFHSYAYYSAAAEDFSIVPDAEFYADTAYRIYENSPLLRYLKQYAHLASQEQARKVSYRHFMFACMEHQVEVISTNPPSIQLLEPKKNVR